MSKKEISWKITFFSFMTLIGVLTGYILFILGLGYLTPNLIIFGLQGFISAGFASSASEMNKERN